MYSVDMYVQVRRAGMVEGMSVREASRVFGLHRDTMRKMLAYSVLVHELESDLLKASGSC